MQTSTPEVCADADKIVNGVLRGFKRRGLPANVDPDDLRQEGLIALAVAPAEKRAQPRLCVKIAWDAMKDALRKNLLGNKRYYTGVLAVEDGAGQPRRTVDPLFVLDVDGLEARHAEWERERKERWA
jgi:hypothetical protein